jgi:hypothetical protein
VAKLNQVIAVEKSVKTRVQQGIDGLYKAIQKPALFDGFVKAYKPMLEDEPTQPQQQQKVQMTVTAVMQAVQNDLVSLFDVVAQKDFANTGATADIEIDGIVLAQGVPTTFLLFLEKQLTDLHTLVSKLPVLDPAEEWQYDEVKQLFKTAPAQTQRTRKVAKPLVLYPATPEHPAQTQVMHEDIPVGVYEHVKLSGATTESARKTLLSRIEKAARAVKFAREKANTVDAPKQYVGEAIIGWIFG